MQVQVVQMSGAITSGEVEFKDLAEVRKVEDGWLVVRKYDGVEVLVRVENILNIVRKQ